LSRGGPHGGVDIEIGHRGPEHMQRAFKGLVKRCSIRKPPKNPAPQSRPWRRHFRNVSSWLQLFM
jgi:hypothetical protein